MASINEKLNYINETKSLIKDKLNDLGSEIENETTFREYAEKIEDLYDEWPKINDEDTTISLNNTKKGKISLQLKGNISQFTTEGKNILPQNKYISTQTTNNIIYTNNGDGTFNLSGTASANTTIQIIPIGELELEANQPYYLYSSEPYNATTFNMSVAMTDNGSAKFVLANGTYTPTTTPTNERLQFYIASGQSVNATNVKLMLVKGNTSPTNYEPYTGGIASPNPDYPQNIQIVTGENTITISNEDNTQSQTFNINLGNLEVCKITDNYQDYFYKENNKWYLYKTIISEIINSATSGNISSYDPSASGKIEKWNYSYHTEHPNSNLLKTTVNGYHYVCANKFTVVVQTSEWNINTGICLSAYGHSDWFELRFRVPTTYTKDQAINFINGTKVYYPTVPSNIEITDTTLITQLDTLEQAMAYNNQTNISQTNDNLPFIISASALLKNSN